MRLRLEDPSLFDDLLAYLRAMGCVAHRDGGTISVVIADARSPEAERAELGVYLDAWRARHEGIAVAVEDGGRPAGQ